MAVELSSRCCADCACAYSCCTCGVTSSLCDCACIAMQALQSEKPMTEQRMLRRTMARRANFMTPNYRGIKKEPDCVDCSPAGESMTSFVAELRILIGS